MQGLGFGVEAIPAGYFPASQLLQQPGFEASLVWDGWMLGDLGL